MGSFNTADTVMRDTRNNDGYEVCIINNVLTLLSGHGDTAPFEQQRTFPVCGDTQPQYQQRTLQRPGDIQTPYHQQRTLPGLGNGQLPYQQRTVPGPGLMPKPFHGAPAMRDYDAQEWFLREIQRFPSRLTIVELMVMAGSLSTYFGVERSRRSL